ncbi:MAG: phospho-N-acetylmuramoyl-pentapeptide-transferase, partial [Pirellulales bacterium]
VDPLRRADMLLWLLDWCAPWLEQIGWYPGVEVIRAITFRGALASVTAFLTAMVLAPPVIRWLARRCPERLLERSPRLEELQRAGRKHRVPTMGGLFILIALLGSVLVWGDLDNRYVQLALLFGAGLGGLGALDDWLKLAAGRDGLTPRQKLAAQTTLAVPTAAVLYLYRHDAPEALQLVVPFRHAAVSLGIGGLAVAVAALVATCNAVNLTDGLDGLAGGCLIFAGGAFAVLTYVAGHIHLAEYLGVPYVAGSGEVSVVLGALLGAVLGFLWFNCFPAQVFMGDTGSLPLGGLIGYAAVVTRQELLLVLVGGVFVAEAFSVLAQVGWFKWRGRRLILCAPLHHHFQFRGLHEMKIVVRFWIAAALLAILAVASLRIG